MSKISVRIEYVNGDIETYEGVGCYDAAATFTHYLDWSRPQPIHLVIKREPTEVGSVHTSKDGSVWVLSANIDEDSRWIQIQHSDQGDGYIGHEAGWEYISRR